MLFEKRAVSRLKGSQKSPVSSCRDSQIENNHMIPTITVLMKIAKALNKRQSYFVDEEKPFRISNL
jgi:transcriptional regulator with XRE-family HTH domain